MEYLGQYLYQRPHQDGRLWFIMVHCLRASGARGGSILNEAAGGGGSGGGWWTSMLLTMFS